MDHPLPHELHVHGRRLPRRRPLLRPGSRAKEWHRLGPGIIATTAFAGALGVATFLHWDEFNHDHVSFWAWTLLYITTPLLLPVLYVKNRQFDPGTAGPEDVPIPTWIRTSLTVLGAGQLLFAITLYLRPSLFQDDWPWTLTTVSARSLAAFAAFPAIAYLAFAFERRWSALRWPFETAIAGLALIAVGAAPVVGRLQGRDPVDAVADRAWPSAWPS